MGAMFRYGLVGFVQNRVPFSTFPYGTLTVNLCGCLLIGVLGGFTTYSTFGYETFALLRDAEFPRALAYVGVHVIAGLALVWAGYNLTTSKWT